MKKIFLSTTMFHAFGFTLVYLMLTICSYAQTTVPQLQQLRTNLYEVATSTNLLDATITQYSVDGNNAVDRRDAVKIQSIAAGTHLGMLRDGKILVIERRQSIIVNDTIFYNLMTASKRNYRFEFIAVKLDWGVVNVFLEDTYLSIFTPVNLIDTTAVEFTVNADAASSAEDRFRLVFEAKPIAPPLPFTFNNVKANQQNNDIAVEWITENEETIKSYYVETSPNGRRFVKTATVSAKGSTSIENYQWVDVNAKSGVHYYRIRSLNENDEVLVSNIVKVMVNRGSKVLVYPHRVVNGKIHLKFFNQPMENNEAKSSVTATTTTVIAEQNNSIENYQGPDANTITNSGKSKIIVYPNPVVNGRINLKFTNQLIGNYVVRVIDNLGRVIIRKEVHLSNSNVIETVEAGKNRVGGVYHLEVISPDNKITSINVIMQ